MTPQTRRYVVVLAALLSLCLLVVRVFHSRDSSELSPIPGTWTDEKGEPGNYIRFGYVQSRMLPVAPVPPMAPNARLPSARLSECTYGFFSSRPLRVKRIRPGSLLVAPRKPKHISLVVWRPANTIRGGVFGLLGFFALLS